MILSYDQVGALYFNLCEDGLYMNLSENNHATNLYDTLIYLIGSKDDELLITNEGHCHMIYAMDIILDKIFKEKDARKYSEVIKMIPEGLRDSLKELNREINAKLIEDKVDPENLFYRERGRQVYNGV